VSSVGSFFSYINDVPSHEPEISLFLYSPKMYYLFTKARHRTVLLAKRIYSTTSHYVSLRSILTSSTYLRLLIPRHLFKFAVKTVHTFLIPPTCAKSPSSVIHITMTTQIIFLPNLPKLRRYSDYTWDARSGVRIPIDVRDFYVLQNVQNGSGAYLPFW